MGFCEVGFFKNSLLQNKKWSGILKVGFVEKYGLTQILSYIYPLAICCFALVAWTIVVTGRIEEPIKSTNGTQITLRINTSLPLCQKNESACINVTTIAGNRIQVAQEKILKQKDSIKKVLKTQKTDVKHIWSPPIMNLTESEDSKNSQNNQNSQKLLCECLCGVNVTMSEILEALQYIKQEKESNELS